MESWDTTWWFCIIANVGKTKMVSFSFKLWETLLAWGRGGSLIVRVGGSLLGKDTITGLEKRGLGAEFGFGAFGGPVILKLCRGRN